MALMECPHCGKSISDKAITCPGCGEVLRPESLEERKLKVCEECGTELEEGAESCPNCGCPVPTKEAEEKIQKVEVSKVALNEKQKKMMIGGIAAIVGIIILIFAGTMLKKQMDKKAAEDAAKTYSETLSSVSSEMLAGAIQAEECGGLIHDVW